MVGYECSWLISMRLCTGWCVSVGVCFGIGRVTRWSGASAEREWRRDNAIGSLVEGGTVVQAVANRDLCTSKLAMPTEFVAQNAMIIRQSTPVSVTRCAKKKALTRAQSSQRHSRRKVDVKQLSTATMK
jgi:hypothetical protein